jgi:hypothetical protein
MKVKIPGGFLNQQAVEEVKPKEMPKYIIKRVAKWQCGKKY